MTPLHRDLVKILLAAGCTKVRDGKGSHEIWQSPLSGLRFPVARTISKRSMANVVLKQAGLPKAF